MQILEMLQIWHWTLHQRSASYRWACALVGCARTINQTRCPTKQGRPSSTCGSHSCKPMAQNKCGTICCITCVLCQHYQLLASLVVLCNVDIQQAAPQQGMAWTQLSCLQSICCEAEGFSSRCQDKVIRPSICSWLLLYNKI